MPISAIKKRIKEIQITTPGYISALSSGYLLTGANMLVQFALTPFYLKYLGERQFGLLMILLSMINFAAIGIGWMSGGLVRIMGERWANDDHKGFRDAFVVGKYVYSIYAILLVGLVFSGWWLGHQLQLVEQNLSIPVLIAGIYFVMLYEVIPERQAFVGTNRQAMGNQLEFARIILFALLTWVLLPKIQDMTAVWIAMMSGVLFQRITTNYYWSRRVDRIGWGLFSPKMKPTLKRLAGKQGVGYVSYGMLLLILQADTMIVGLLGGAEVAGKFVLLWKIPEAIGLLLWRIPSTIQPRIIELDASGKHEIMYELFIRGRRWYFLIVLFVSLAYMALGKWVTELWVGEYAPTENWMYIVAGLALFFNVFARWPISFAYALIRLRPLVKVALVEVIFKVMLTILLYDDLSIAAPIVSLIITHVLFACISYQRLINN